MKLIEITFWSFLSVIFYAYAGYGILAYVMVRIKRILNKKKHTILSVIEPEVTFVVPCYNEGEIIEQKVKNTLALNYPKDKLQIIFITDGSTDGTPELLQKFEGIKILHDAKRGGKSAAENRAMKHVEAPIVIFSDANTILPPEAVNEIVKHYADPEVGAVSGEKRIMKMEKEEASGAGEGFYWKYESFLKRIDSELHTIVGAAGELFSFRKELFHELEEDTILDDFILSLRIASKGYRVVYEPKAYAMETASANVKEELKRKIRICAGGWQSMVRLSHLLNPFRHPLLTFEYISHRVLRWSVAPLFLLLLVPFNIVLATQGYIYQLFLLGQMMFYASALSGWMLENRRIKVKVLFIPYYFFIMNYSVFAGFFRYMKGKQSAAWERSRRGTVSTITVNSKDSNS